MTSLGKTLRKTMKKFIGFFVNRVPEVLG